MSLNDSDRELLKAIIRHDLRELARQLGAVFDRVHEALTNILTDDRLERVERDAPRFDPEDLMRFAPPFHEPPPVAHDRPKPLPNQANHRGNPAFVGSGSERRRWR